MKRREMAMRDEQECSVKEEMDTGRNAGERGRIAKEERMVGFPG